jgi:spore coat polysaccharide biosynthesis predicted glycosyltransferase SpsG
VRLLVRCDAGRTTGVGHLVRGLSVATAARAAGWEVALAGQVETPWARAEVDRAGLTVLDAGPGTEVVALARSTGVDALHVDHYGMPSDDTLLRRCTDAGVVLSNVADFAFGARPAHLTVNPNFGAGPASDRLLAGPRYALVRDDVLRARAARAVRPEHPALHGVVVLGGTDPFGATGGVVEAALAAADAPVELDVLTSDADALARRFGNGSAEVTLRFRAPTRDLPGLLATSDLAVTAAGTTLLELACIGVPAAALCVTENQRIGYESAVAAGTVLGLGNLDEGTAAWVEPWRRLLSDGTLRATIAATGLTTVDGQGAARLVRRIDEIVRAGA